MRFFRHLTMLVAACVPLALGGCAGNMDSAIRGVKQLSIDVNTAGIRCTRVSPEIHVSGTPTGTVIYRFKLKDLDVPTWNHGGGDVKADPSGVIPAGAIHGGYNGPCPPEGTHTYLFSVEALDASGAVLAVGSQSIPM
jgi:phosphatidylethanolamine-binding protein (PEBP) family uncharacterized protein